MRRSRTAELRAARLAKRKNPRARASASSVASSAAPIIDAGVRISPSGNTLYISSVETGSAGEQAGLKPLDEILKVNGIEPRKYTTESLQEALNGPEGTSIELEIARQKDGGILSITLVHKAKIARPEYAVSVAGGIAQVTIDAFTPETAEPLRRDLASLDWKSVRGVIVDLRETPYGTLTGMQPILGAFLPTGTPFAAVEFANVRRDLITTTLAPLVPATLPIVVLIQEESSGDGMMLFAYNLADKRDAVILSTEKGITRSYGAFTLDIPGNPVWLHADRKGIEYYGIRATAIPVTPVPGRDAALEKAKFYIDYSPSH